MTRTEKVKFRDRQMPDYTKGEEIFNMVSHIVGAGFGVIARARRRATPMRRRNSL